MAVSWGGYESSGGLGMRVGLEVNVEGGGMTHTEVSCRIDVEYWTQNIHSWDDDQSLNLGGSIGGSISYHNGQGEGAVKRGPTKTYWYEYGPNEYKTNAQRTFSATVNGAFNGVSPSKSVTVNIPDRPYGVPATVTSATVSRISDESNRVTWNNRATVGEPYDTVHVDRYIYGVSGWTRVANLGGTAESFADASAVPNRRYQYRVIVSNNVGTASAWDYTGDIWTVPGTPTGCVRTQVDSTHQKIDWNNNVFYSDHEHQVYVSVDGAAYVLQAEPASGLSTYTHTTEANKKYRYKVRAKTTVGPAIYSSYSGETTESGGIVTPPSPPTNLAPAGSVVMDPAGPIVLSWKHNATDGKAQVQYEVQHREVLGSTWVSTGVRAVVASSHTLAPDTYLHSKSVEWQVRTWGTDPGPSGWSATATFLTSPAVAKKYPMFLDVTSGRMEANSHIADDIDTGWKDLTLVNGWVNYGGGFPTAQYRRVHGVVYLKGLVRNGTVGTNIAILPVGFRPLETNIFASGHNATAAASAGTAHYHSVAASRIDVTSGGAIDHLAGAANGYVSLSGISFIAEDGPPVSMFTIGAEATSGGGELSNMEAYEASPTGSNLSLTTTHQVVPGCLVTVPVSGPSEKLLVVMTADLDWVSSTGSTASAALTVDGVEHADWAMYQTTSSSRTTASQNYLISGLTAGIHEFGMKAWAGTNALMQLVVTHTHFTVVRLVAPKGDPGPPGVTPTVSYTHAQAVAAASWVIDHPLPYRPNVSVVDSAGRQVEGDVVYTDADTVTIGFSGAFAGTAYLS